MHFCKLQWENHNQSLLLEAQARTRIQKQIEEKVNKCQGTWIDWQYLLRAGELLAKASFNLNLAQKFVGVAWAWPRSLINYWWKFYWILNSKDIDGCLVGFLLPGALVERPSFLDCDVAKCSVTTQRFACQFRHAWCDWRPKNRCLSEVDALLLF